jgi:L-2,4-diaminobutyrate decarboxylase
MSALLRITRISRHLKLGSSGLHTNQVAANPVTEPNNIERAFLPDIDQLHQAINLLASAENTGKLALPMKMPEAGVGAEQTMASLSGPVLGDARNLGAPGFFAHMDPPTPWITWAMQLWTASRNQNLLHPDTAPVAREIEQRVIDWLAPSFGMSGGHMVPGSTIANLTALWAAREAGAHTVVSTKNAHLSVAKAAHLLGMPHRSILNWNEAGGLDGCVAVITAGTTSTGEVEPLDAAKGAKWRHVDAAWAGPLVLSERHRSLLAGITHADSIAVSAHKWLFQPKESAIVLFADVAAAHRSVSFGADYLAVPNVGVCGSHGAMAVPLLATLLAYGRQGIVEWIDHSMELTSELARLVEAEPTLEMRTAPQTGVLNWRHVSIDAAEVQRRLPSDIFISITTIDGEPWLRSVCANPMADPRRVVNAVVSLAPRV